MTLWIYFLIAPLFQFASLTSCGLEEENRIVFQKEGYELPYEMFEPEVVFELPESLKEISGLTILPDSNLLAAVQDEVGVVYFINKIDGKVVKEVAFWGDGDFEGIEAVGEKIYTVKSNGDVFVIEDYLSDSVKSDRIKTFLNKDANVEGLGYNETTKKLLMACKGIPDGLDDDQKNIYSFDIETLEIDTTPSSYVNLQMVRNYLGSEEITPYAEKIMDKINPDEGGFTFAPSAIAQHPITEEFYILSSVGKLLMVLSAEGEINYIEKLDKKILPQPEGICFEKNGTMWISSEGKKSGNGTVLKYNLKNAR
ncbi:MAG: SdiA-regulated domain-containing protein [Saprospiraceae bacterium]